MRICDWVFVLTASVCTFFAVLGAYVTGYHRGFEFRDRIAHIELLLAGADDKDYRLHGANPLNSTFCGQAVLAREWLAPLRTHQGANSAGYYDSAITYVLKQYDDQCRWEKAHPQD